MSGFMTPCFCLMVVIFNLNISILSFPPIIKMLQVLLLMALRIIQLNLAIVIRIKDFPVFTLMQMSCIKGMGIN